MDGHDLDRVVAGLDVGERVELGDLFRERGEVDAAGVFQLLQLVEVGVGVLELGAAARAGGAAEGEPPRRVKSSPPTTTGRPSILPKPIT